MKDNPPDTPSWNKILLAHTTSGNDRDLASGLGSHLGERIKHIGSKCEIPIYFIGYNR
jgi:hypothetical protein